MKLRDIPFNKLYLTGNEMNYIEDAIASGKISGNGKYTRYCHDFFRIHYGFGKCLLTTSCTDALEMTAILLDLVTGDEVIMPSYTFVSTANAFVLRGATIVFADSGALNPNIDEDGIESLVTERTKAIVIVHYAGISCNMDKIMVLALKYNLVVIEDAAQAIGSYYINGRGEKKALGSIGHLAALSFHETKNITSGEGGMLVINDSRFEKRVEIIWEKGTNRTAFFRGEVEKYDWVDIGSSFLPSEIIAAFLFAQLEQKDKIQEKRLAIWKQYYNGLQEFESAGVFRLPGLPAFATNNAHMLYVVCNTPNERRELIQSLKGKGIAAVFHYLSLHQSPFYKNKHDGRCLPLSNQYSERLVRLPIYFELKEEEVNYIIKSVKEFYCVL